MDLQKQLAGVQALIFDVDGTLYSQKPVRRAMMARMAKAYLVRPATGYRVAKLIAAYRRGQEELRESTSGSIPLADAQLRFAADRTGIDVPTASAWIDRWMHDEPLSLLAKAARPGILTTLETARRRDMRTGVLSDYPAESKLRSLGVHHLFDVIVCAQDPDVNCFKPNPKGLQVAMDRLGTTASNTLYIGDRPSVDGETAERLGMRWLIVGSAAESAENGVKDFTDLDACLRQIAV